MSSPEPQAAKEQEHGSDHSSLVQRLLSVGPQGVMQGAGLVFTVAAIVAFVYAISSLIYLGAARGAREAGGVQFDVWRELIQPNVSLIGLIGIGCISALLALRLFSKAGALTSQVVRPVEAPYLWPLISTANKGAINEYIRLASLAGFSGTFTKLGFTGLPLVTVALTLILLAMTMLIQDQELSKGMFDLAKLTLGAFLGSFVQRNIEQEKLVGGQNSATTGEGTPPLDQATAEKAGAQRPVPESR